MEDATPYLGVLDEGRLEMIEATLHPHARIEGRTVADLKLGERLRVLVSAIWRNGRAYPRVWGP